MSTDTKTAKTINFPEAPATVLLRASDLATSLGEVLRLGELVKEIQSSRLRISLGA